MAYSQMAKATQMTMVSVCSSA